MPTVLMDVYRAAMIADGEWELIGEEPNSESYLAAYQHLVNTGAAWKLQGRIGREATRLVDAGLVTLPTTNKESDEPSTQSNSSTK